MFSNLTISIVIGLGCGVWLYTRVLRSTGNNVKNAVTVAIVSGVLIIFAATIILDAVLKKH